MEHVPATGLDALAMTVPIQKNDGAEGLRKPVFLATNMVETCCGEVENVFLDLSNTNRYLT